MLQNVRNVQKPCKYLKFCNIIHVEMELINTLGEVANINLEINKICSIV